MDLSVLFFTAFVCFVAGYAVCRMHHPNGDSDKSKPADRYCVHCTWCRDPQSVSPWCGKFRDPVGKPRYCTNLRRLGEDCGPQGKYWEPSITTPKKEN